ncbi:hypothetical protein SUDANB1_05611 [Streptomyces sp. enrichment culture]|uniref:hypothetical protein n=1 Tax=Streptomyces sp. enrichment culture TaxID=1795815 RepID=UPI003F56B35D
MTPEQRLLHLVGRAERCALLPEESAQLREGIAGLQRDLAAARASLESMTMPPGPVEFASSHTTYRVQTQQPDDSWSESSSGMGDPEFARTRLARRRERMPDMRHRLGYRLEVALSGVLPEPAATEATSERTRPDRPDGHPEAARTVSGEIVRPPVADDDGPAPTSADTRPDGDPDGTPDASGRPVAGVRVEYRATVPRHQLGAALAEAFGAIEAERRGLGDGNGR